MWSNLQKKMNLGVLFVMILALIGCATTPQKPNQIGAGTAEKLGPFGTRSASVYMPLNLGNSWTYNQFFLGEKRSMTVTIQSRDKEGYFLDNMGGKFRLTQMGLSDGKRYLLLAPLEEGHKWRAQISHHVAEYFEIIEDNKTISIEAGVFKHCLTVRSSTQMSEHVRMENLVTYAPHIGMLKTETWLVNSRGDRKKQVVAELASYKLP